MKRWLITGGLGFAGSALIRTLLSKPEPEVATVINLDAETYSGTGLGLIDVTGDPRYTFIKADLRHREQIDQAIDHAAPDVAVHFAAETHVDRSIDDPATFLETNVLGTFHLLETIREHLNDKPSDNFRFIHVSTDEIYGSQALDQDPVDESGRYEPRNPYAASKAGADHLVDSYVATYGFPAIVLHSSNLFGPAQFPEKLIPATILRALAGEPLQVYGNGEQLRDWLFVDDLAEAVIRAVNAGSIGQHYNLPGRSERTNLSVVQAICEILDRLEPHDTGSYRDLIRHVEDRPGHDLRYAMDGRRFTGATGWEPISDFSLQLESTVAWILENRDGVNRIAGKHQALKRRGMGKR